MLGTIKDIKLFSVMENYFLRKMIFPPAEENDFLFEKIEFDFLISIL